MGVNRQQALQGGLASHQLVNVREQEDGNITRELTSSQAVETQQHNEKEKKKTIWQLMGLKKLFCRELNSTNTTRSMQTAHLQIGKLRIHIKQGLLLNILPCLLLSDNKYRVGKHTLASILIWQGAAYFKAIKICSVIIQSG